jgi:LmbE family N-acetylglucosaminyl deacetylase
MADSQISGDVDTIRIIEDVVASCDPDIIYTHSGADTHQDHRNIHFASLVAGRAVAGLYCYGSPSLTNDFRPVRFNDIGDKLNKKLSLLKCFESQQHRPYFDPELIIAKAMYWGSVGRWRYAEPLEVIHERSSGHIELIGHGERVSTPLRTTHEDELEKYPSRAGAAIHWK